MHVPVRVLFAFLVHRFAILDSLPLSHVRRKVQSSAGLGEGALSTLQDEAVFSIHVFQRLREEHFERLLPKLTVGEHAILLQLWETKGSVSQEVYPIYVLIDMWVELEESI